MCVCVLRRCIIYSSIMLRRKRRLNGIHCSHAHQHSIILRLTMLNGLRFFSSKIYSIFGDIGPIECRCNVTAYQIKQNYLLYLPSMVNKPCACSESLKETHLKIFQYSNKVTSEQTHGSLEHIH